MVAQPWRLGDSPPSNSEYLDDGVYAHSDGYGIWLLIQRPDFEWHGVYLEPKTLKRLNMFVEGSSRVECQNSSEAMAHGVQQAGKGGDGWNCLDCKVRLDEDNAENWEYCKMCWKAVK